MRRLIAGFSGMRDLVGRVEGLAQLRAPALDVRRVHVGEVRIEGLRLDDGVEIAAIGDVDAQRAEALDLDLVILAVEERRHIGDAHRVDEGAVLRIARLDEAGRRVEPEQARRLGLDEAVLERDRHRADGAVAAHRQAARSLDEENPDVAVVARRRVEDRARHHVVAARLEHQPGADPVVPAEKMLAALEHRRALERRDRAAGDDPDRIAAGVAVDAEEGVARHGPRMPLKCCSSGPCS